MKINPLDFGKVTNIETICEPQSRLAIIITIEILPDSAEEIEIIKEALIENIGGAPDE